MVVNQYLQNYPFLFVNYKDYNNITQLFHRFKNNKIFVFNMNLWKKVTLVLLL